MSFFQLASFKGYIVEFKKCIMLFLKGQPVQKSDFKMSKVKMQAEETKKHSGILLKYLFGFVYNLIKYVFFPNCSSSSPPVFINFLIRACCLRNIISVRKCTHWSKTYEFAAKDTKEFFILFINQS